MLMLKILENDLHRSRKQEAVSFMVEVPANPAWMPMLVTSTRGKFLVSRHLTPENRVKVGMFDYDSDKIDEIVPAMLAAALELSRAENWENVFALSDIKSAFNYIKDESHMPVQPHVCIVPTSWESGKVAKVFGLKNGVKKHRKYCNIVHANVSFVTFLSKPDMVGLYTHILGGPASIVIHNVRRGMAFCA